MTTIIHSELDGKKIAYHSGTEFYVQIGKFARGSYKTRYKFVGNLAQAVFFYNAINIGNDYKKRLFCPAMSKPVLAKKLS